MLSQQDNRIQNLGKTMTMIADPDKRVLLTGRDPFHAEALPRMIAFFGADGAGKSTQAELVVKYLVSRRVRVKKAWIRSTHTVAFLLWKLFMIFNLRRDREAKIPKMPKLAMPYVGDDLYGVVSPISMQPPVLVGRVSRFIWSAIEVISILPVILLRVYLPLLLGYVVVAERYVLDSIATISYFVDDEEFSEGRLGRLLLTLIPRCTVFVFIDADYGTIVSRRGRLAGPSGYTEFHRRIYAKLALKVGAIKIDTSKMSVDETFEKITHSMMMRMGDSRRKHK